MAEIGSTLREARMRAHIDISEVEASTKIRAKYLRAIENEEWDLLPGAVYVKSFLRTYGEYLGLDTRLLIDEFKRRYERPADNEARPISGVNSRERERGSRRRPRASFSLSPRVVIGAAIVVIVVALYLIGSRTSDNTPTGRTITPPNVANHKGKAKGKGKGGKGSKRGTSTIAHTTTRGTTTTPVVPKKATLELVATGSVWVCVVGPHNKLLIPGLVYQPGGTKIPAESATKLLVRLGNGNVTATVNGKPYTITRSASAIGLKINAAGAKPLASPPLCAG